MASCYETYDGTNEKHSYDSESGIPNVGHPVQKKIVLWRCRRRRGGAGEDSGCSGGGGGGQLLQSVDGRHVTPSGGQRRLGGDNHAVD